MGDVHLVINSAVDFQRTYVALLVAHSGRFDFQRIPVGQLQLQVWQVGCSQYVLVGAGAYGVEAHDGEYVPSRHLPAVVVASQSVGRIAVHLVQDFAQPVLGLPRLRGPCVEVGDVVAGFVAMYISAYEACLRDVLVLFVELLGQVHREQLVQLVDEHLFAAHQRDEARHVVGHVEGEVPGIAFDEAFPVGLQHIEVGLERTVLQLGTCKADAGVEEVAVVEGALAIGAGHLLVAGFQSCLVDGPVVVGILQCRGGRGGTLFEG